MADGTEYVVSTFFDVKGDKALQDALRRNAAAAEQMSASFSKGLGGLRQLGGGLVDFASTIAGAAVGAAGAGLAIGLATSAAIAHGFMSNLSMLEDASNSMAAVIGAATGTSFAKAKTDSAALFNEFRQDAISSAGETADFVNIAKGIAGPLMGAGHSMEELHKLTKLTVSAASSLGIGFDEAGHGMTRMLQGAAIQRDPFFRALQSIPALGIKSAKEFNALSADVRMEKILTALSNPAFLDAAQAYGNSWTGLLATFVDLSKEAGNFLGAPIFELAKQGLKGFTTSVIDEFRHGSVTSAMRAFGQDIVDNFTRLWAVVKPMLPDAFDSARGVLGWLQDTTDAVFDKMIAGTQWVRDHWGQIKDTASQFADVLIKAAKTAEHLVEVIGGGDLATGVKRIGEMMLARQAYKSLGIGDMAMGGAALVQGGAGAARWLGAGAAEAAEIGVAAPEAVAGARAAVTAGAGAGAGAGAAAEAGGLAVPLFGAAPDLAAFTAGTGGATAAIGALTAGALILGAAVGAIGSTFAAVEGNIAGVGKWFKGAVGELWDSLGNFGTALGGVWASLMSFWDVLKPIIAIMSTPMMLVINSVIEALSLLVDGSTALINSFGMAIASFASAIRWMENKLGIKHDDAGAFDKLLGDAAEQNERKIDSRDFIRSPIAQTHIEYKKEGTKAAAAAQKVQVEIKWDLGDGNEDALYVRTRKDIQTALREATVFPKMSRLFGV